MLDLFGRSGGPPVAGKLTLHSLRLRHFMGIKSFDLDLDGANAIVYGDNGVGKSTLFSAFTFLLWGKDSLGQTDFALKTLDKDNQPIHGLEHEVEGVFRLGAREFTLRKVYSEQWTKQRGSAQKQFTGHTTEHFVDGVPVRKADYEARVAEIIDEGKLRLLSDPAYFSEQLPWQERRKLLLDVCGDLTDEEVIASDPSLAPLTAILAGRSLDDHKAAVKAARSKLNGALEQIPIRISEVQRGLPEAVNATTATARLTDAREVRQKKSQELALIEGGGEAARGRKRLAKIEAAILSIETRERRKLDEALAGKRRSLSEVETSIQGGQRQLEDLGRHLGRIEEGSRNLTAEIEALQTKFRAVSAEEFSHPDELACPTCGQALPAETVQAAREKALKLFNAGRAERLERLDADSRALRVQRDEADKGAESCRRDIATAKGRLGDLRETEARLKAEIGDMEAPLDLSQDPDWRPLAAERDNLTAALVYPPRPGAPDTTELRAEIAQLEASVANMEAALSDAEQRAKGLARIEELGAEEKRLAAEYERLEAELFLCEAFIRAQVRGLTGKINARFRITRWKLFDTQVNGAVEECCVATHDGVPYGAGLNNGARVNVGLDILDCLSQHYGFSAPVWVDGAESVTRLLPVRGQLIRLVVSESDKVLRVTREVE